MTNIDLFKLNSSQDIIIQHEKDFAVFLEVSSCLSNIIYKGNNWPKNKKSTEKNKIFKRMGLGWKTFKDLTFTKCEFYECDFRYSIFDNVRFHDCKFINCNLGQIEIVNCYWDPQSVVFSTNVKKVFANIATWAYKKLTKNADQQDQSDHKKYADIQFERCEIYQYKYYFLEKRISYAQYIKKLFLSNFFYITSRYGYEWVRFGVYTIILFLLVTLFNQYFLQNSLKIDGTIIPIANGPDAIFYSFNILTSLGFSNIVPITDHAKFITVIESFSGVVWMGFFISVLTKRILG